MEKLEAKIERLKAKARLTDMKRDMFYIIAGLLDLKDVCRLDESMVNRKGRAELSEAFDIGGLEYKGFVGDHRTLNRTCLQWLIKRKIGVRGLCTQSDVPSFLAFQVARNSPNLKNLNVMYDPDNSMQLSSLDKCCPLLEEVNIQSTKVVSFIDEHGKFVIQLKECQEYPSKSFCETARLNACAYKNSDWDRAPHDNKFNWQRFIYSAALTDAASIDDTVSSHLLIRSALCNVSAVSSDSSTALKWSCYHRNLGLVRAILQIDTRNIDVSSNYGNRSTSLMWACLHGDAAIIELLLQNKSASATTARNSSNLTAFQLLDKYGGTLSQEEKSRLKDIHWMNEIGACVETQMKQLQISYS